jgi:hypothetical protein
VPEPLRCAVCGAKLIVDTVGDGEPYCPQGHDPDGKPETGD